MKEVLAAVNNKIRGDAAVMVLLGGRGPFYGRLPEDSPHTREEAAITMEFESIADEGGTESQIVTLHIYGYRKMLLEDVSLRVDVLFHDFRYRWVPLAMPAGRQAFTRVEFRADVNDPASELYQKIVRIRVMFGKDQTVNV